MDSKLLLQSTYLDVIFDGRNKAYGSYELRISYAKRMKRAGVFISLFCLFFYAYSVWANRTKIVPLTLPTNNIDTIAFINPTLDIPKTPPPMPPAMANKTNVNTIKLLEPDIVENNQLKEENKMLDQEDMKKAVSGPITLHGDDISNTSFDQNNSKGKGPFGDDIIEHNNNEKIGSKIEKFVEQMPEFDGGEEKLREFLHNNLQYPQAAFSNNQQGKVFVRFVVNEDGRVSNIEAFRGFGYGSEQEASRVVAAMPRWKPGKNNGKAVKVWIQLPIVFKLN